MLVYAVPVLLASAFLIHAIAFRNRTAADFFAVAAVGISFALVLLSGPGILSGQIYIFHMGGWPPPTGIVIAADSLSWLMALIAAGLGFCVSLYSLSFIKRKQGEYYALLLLLVAGMVGFAITGDLFNMYVFFEIMSVSSYGLAAWLRTKKSLEGAFKFLVMGSLGTSLILLGTAFIYGLTGTLSLADIGLKIRGVHGFEAALGIIVTGFLIKSAAFPFHGWKPDAVEGTVAPVAGLLSGVSTALGVYGLVRMLFIFDMLRMSWIVIGLGVVTMTMGAVMALMQDELKRLLAYSSISQVGYILMALGLGAAGLTAGLFHLFNNAILKVMLFLAAGVVLYHTGTTRMDKLGGIGRSVPVTAAAFLIGALGVAGIPGLNGFASKFLIYLSLWEVSPALTAAAVIVSAVTLAYYLKVFSCIFLGPPNKEIRIRKKTPKLLLAPIVALAFLSVLFGVWPDLAMAFIKPAEIALLNLNNYIDVVLAGG